MYWYTSIVTGTGLKFLVAKNLHFTLGSCSFFFLSHQSKEET